MGSTTDRPLWLIRSQLEVLQIWSSFEVKISQQKERLRDLEHYLRQDWRFANFIFHSDYIGPGRSRDKAIEEFWISVYNGHHQNELDLLQAREQAVAEFFHLRDEIDEVHESPKSIYKQG
jgi:hypothetical protein